MRYGMSSRIETRSAVACGAPSGMPWLISCWEPTLRQEVEDSEGRSRGLRKVCKPVDELYRIVWLFALRQPEAQEATDVECASKLTFGQDLQYTLYLVVIRR